MTSRRLAAPISSEPLILGLLSSTPQLFQHVSPCPLLAGQMSSTWLSPAPYCHPIFQNGQIPSPQPVQTKSPYSSDLMCPYFAAHTPCATGR